MSPIVMKNSPKKSRIAKISLTVATMFALTVSSPTWSAGYFANPTAADSAFAPVDGSTAQTRNSISNSSALSSKGQVRLGNKAIDYSGMANEVQSIVGDTINNRIDNYNQQLTQYVNNAVAAVSSDTLGTISSVLGTNAPIIQEFTAPVTNQSVMTMPFNGNVTFTIVGAGSGGNAGYQNTSGYGGNGGQVIYEQTVSVTKGQPISVTVGTGGAGAATTSANPGAGGLSSVTIGSNVYAAQGGAAQTSPKNSYQPPNSVFINYLTNDPGDGAPGYSGGFGGLPIDSVTGQASTSFLKAVRGTGGGATRGQFYAKSGTLALLSGQGDATFGAGGGGGAPSLLYVPSRGFNQDPINGDSGPGNYYLPGSKGGDGYVRIRVYDPNAIVTSSGLSKFVSQGGAQDANIDLYNSLASFGTQATKTYSNRTGSYMGSGYAGYDCYNPGAVELKSPLDQSTHVYCDTRYGGSSISVVPTTGNYFKLNFDRWGAWMRYTLDDAAAGVYKMAYIPTTYQYCGTPVYGLTYKITVVRTGGLISDYSVTESSALAYYSGNGCYTGSTGD